MHRAHRIVGAKNKLDAFYQRVISARSEIRRTPAADFRLI